MDADEIPKNPIDDENDENDENLQARDRATTF